MVASNINAILQGDMNDLKLLTYMNEHREVSKYILTFMREMSIFSLMKIFQLIKK